ncbi:MAG: TfuA-like protein [Ktedonobacteraceae bacterium]
MHKQPLELFAPIVYLGPSLNYHEAQSALPGSDLRGPIRRGDLYRERLLRRSVFIIIDGVFLQEQAVSPREIIDVIADGALVVGASSMGALRAAECWPVGMRGIGSIYRLFRYDCLKSDDEVAVAFDPSDSYRPLSVPLINVRYALSRAVRAGWLHRAEAERAARAAEELFYPHRHWRILLERAGLAHKAGHLEAWLSKHDLKKMDALRALRAVSRWIAAKPELADRPRKAKIPFAPPEEVRELDHDALAGASAQEVKERLARWCLVSGRYTRHLLTMATLHSHLERRVQLAPADERTSIQIDNFLAHLGVFSDREKAHWFEHWSHQREAIARSAALSLALTDLWSHLATDMETFSESLWATLAFSGDLDAAIFRWRAIHEAADKARQLGFAARPHDRYLAEAEIAHAHGCYSWSELCRVAEATLRPWAWFVEYRDELAMAKCMRTYLFNVARDST